MSQDIFYCSELSREVHESPTGTASIGEVWLLLEHRAPWGPNPLEDSNLPPLVKRHLARTIKAIPRSRLLFIRQERAPERPLKFFVVFSREHDPFSVEFEFEDPDELLNLDISAAVAGYFGKGVVTREPFFLVCTHGRRDKCCAKFGFALYKSLKEVAGDCLWQSSHVGGDRFAANLVSFPHGLFHAHVTKELGIWIFNSYVNGHLSLSGFRGRACYGRAVQAAELFIRRASGIFGVEDLTFQKQKRLGENSWLVSFLDRRQSQIHAAQVSTRSSAFQNFMTCHAVEEQRVAQYSLDEYIVISLPDNPSNYPV